MKRKKIMKFVFLLSLSWMVNINSVKAQIWIERFCCGTGPSMAYTTPTAGDCSTCIWPDTAYNCYSYMGNEQPGKPQCQCPFPVAVEYACPPGTGQQRSSHVKK